MLKYLKDARCIDYAQLLILRAKELELKDHEVIVLLIIISLMKMNMKAITPQLVLKYSSMTPKRLDSTLESLLNKKYIFNAKGSIRLNRIEDKLLSEVKEEIQEDEINLLDIFQEQFGRPLTSLEMEIIMDWKQTGYSDENIILALKEATKAQVLNCRYIEGILINWQKNGVSVRYADTQEPQESVEVSDYQWWKDE